jgi:hypothetical protein
MTGTWLAPRRGRIGLPNVIEKARPEQRARPCSRLSEPRGKVMPAAWFESQRLIGIKGEGLTKLFALDCVYQRCI